jgi:hypothetical protein
MFDGFDCESLTMWAGGQFDFAYAEQVKVEADITCLELHEK